MDREPVVIENFIDGVPRPGRGRDTTLTDPATEQPYGRVRTSNTTDVDDACAAASTAFAAWRGSTPADRAHALLGIADAIEGHTVELAELESLGTGKPVATIVDDELPFILDTIRFFAGAARSVSGSAAGSYAHGTTSLLRRDPIGVCAQITPWNYPLMMATWKWAPAIAAGNAVILKPAETTPASAAALARLAAPFLPRGLFNVVCGDRDTGRALVDHPSVAMVSLTGSIAAGRDVATTAGRSLKRIHLELGGNAPVVVFDDADITAVATTIATAGFVNAGQDCTAATRLIVHRSIKRELEERLVALVSTLPVGGPEVPDAVCGPLNSAAQLERVRGFFERLPSHARLLLGGHRMDRPGYFWAPTVISGCRNGDEVVSEELFAPIVTIETFDTEAQAVQLANDSVYGLASSVWTQELSRAHRISDALDYGVVWVNTHMNFVSEMPHGGRRNSGSGSDLSALSLEEYTRPKHVMVAHP